MAKNKYNTYRKKRKNTASRTLLVFFIILLVAIAIYVVCLVTQGDNSTTAGHANQTTPNQSVTSQDATTDTSTKESEDPFQKTPIQNEGDNPNSGSQLTGSISRSSVNEGQLNLLFNIDQLLGAGTCDLTLTSGGYTKKYTANVIANPASSSCEGFSVPVADLAASKNWHIKLLVTSGNKTGIIEGDVSL